MRWLGFTVALLAFLTAGYEMVALLSPDVPTISRIVQGWRDDGFGTLALFVTIVMVGSVFSFGRWLWYHLRRDKRSEL